MIKQTFFFADDSDDPTGLVTHLPRRLLGGAAVAKRRKLSAIGGRAARLEAASDSEEEEGVRERDPILPQDWSRTNPKRVGTNTPEFRKPVLSDDDKEQLAGLSSAYDYYKLFSSDSYINEVVYQSRLYAVQKNHTKALELLSKDTLRCTEAMLLHGGYHSVPRRKMSWEMKPDCRNELVAGSIRRNEVDAVLQCLHFRDNTLLDSDGYYKASHVKICYRF